MWRSPVRPYRFLPDSVPLDRLPTWSLVVEDVGCPLGDMPIFEQQFYPHLNLDSHINKKCAMKSQSSHQSVSAANCRISTHLITRYPVHCIPDSQNSKCPVLEVFRLILKKMNERGRYHLCRTVLMSDPQPWTATCSNLSIGLDLQRS
jgi:hypothetical protein